MDSNRQLRPRIAVFSLGSIGRRHLRNARRLLPGADIAVLSQGPGARLSIPEGANRRLASLEEAVAFDPDIAIIASPAPLHAENAVPMLANARGVFIEKPLVATAKDLPALEEAARTAAGFAMVGYVLRFQPIFWDVKRLLAEGTVGAPLTATIQVGQYLPDWRPGSDYRQGVSARSALGGGALLELSHELDYAQWVFGKAQEVFCIAERLSDLEIDVEDSAVAVLGIPTRHGSMRVTVQLDFLQRAPQMTMQVVGSEGTLKADFIGENIVTRTLADDDWRPARAQQQQEAGEMYLRQFDLLFHRALPAYRPVFAETPERMDWADIESAAAVMRLVAAAKRSSAEGRLIALDAENLQGAPRL